MKDFRELRAWQKSHQLTLAVYELSRSFSGEDIYGLTPHIRRAVLSISTNIAHGCGREEQGELARYCNLARASASELEYHLLLAHDLKLIQDEDYDEIAERVTEVKQMLTNLIEKLKLIAVAHR